MGLGKEEEVKIKMADWKNYAEGNTLSMEYVSNLLDERRTGVIIKVSPAVGQYGTYPKCVVELNGKEKLWNMNQVSAQEMINVLGSDDAKWVGVPVKFSIGRNSKNQPILVGIPVGDHHISIGHLKTE